MVDNSEVQAFAVLCEINKDEGANMNSNVL